MMHRSPVICYDFDGTIIPFNSFRVYIVYSVLWAISSFRFLATFGIFCGMVKKMIGRIDHLKFKEILVIRTADMGKSHLALFARICLLFSRSSLVNKISDQKAAGNKLVLCTAAPYLYARLVAELYKFDLCVSYGDPELGYDLLMDNSKEVKMERVVSLCGEIQEMYSDHSDDLPLLSAANEAFVVAPSVKQEILISSFLKNYTVIR